MAHYEDTLLPIASANLDKFIDIAKALLPKQYIRKPWELTKHGTNIIDDIDCLCAYLAAYGEMHAVKCKAACQNFPFADIHNHFEIVDWGCGQGIASISIIEIFNERGLLNYLKKVTLIEPSTMALQRALLHMAKSVKKDIIIDPINLYMPGEENNVINSIEFNYPITIHLFSNILDIPTISLAKLSKTISSSGRKHFILCMGPLNSNAKRIDEFCEYFGSAKYFSNISSAKYAITSDTHYQFSCKTKCFEFQTNNFTWNSTVKESSPNYNYEDDYNESMVEKNLPLGSKDLYYKLKSQLDEQDDIFIKPNINGDIPDFVIVRPNKGVMLVNVCLDYNAEKMEQTLDFIKAYQENIIKEHLSTLLDKSLKSTSYWKIIKTMIYYPNINEESLRFKREEIGKEEHKAKIYTVIIGRDTIQNTNVNLFQKAFFDANTYMFNSDIYNSFMKLVTSKFHSYKEGLSVNMTKQQKKLSESTEGIKQKIRGVAGSGKTQVLSARAVNAHLRSGEEVLVLTFNIALVNYIRYRIGNIPADFVWDKFFITNYHQFFKSQANNHRLKLQLDSFDDTSFFNSVNKQTHRYKSIFIDEIQDYKTEWLEVIVRYFLSENGELVVFGDAKQNVYHRSLDENKEIVVKGVPGKWNESLNQGFRFSNGKLTDLAMAFQRVFFPDHNHDVIFNNPTLSFEEETFFKYANITTPKSFNDFARWISCIIDRYKIDKYKIVVLSLSNDFLRNVEYQYRLLSKKENTITFETHEQYFGLSKLDERAIKTIRKNRKIHFTMDTNQLKMSTIHSFKGWEAHTIILFIESNPKSKDNDEELIYTAITRAKKNLFIFNIGNTRYDNFFGKFQEQ